MKTKKYLTVLTVMMMMASFAVAGPPYTIDGDLSDWGIVPFSDWVADSPTADCVVHDYDGTNPVDNPSPYDYPYGGELFDIEMMCFDDGPGVAYFATVTSMPEAGYGSYLMGDLALDMDSDGTTGEYGYEYGIKMTGPNKGLICYMPNWYPATDIHINDPSTFTCDGASSVAYIEKAMVSWANAGVNDYAAGCSPVGGVCLRNWVIEVKVKKALIGLPEGDTGAIHFTQSCGNDDIELYIDWDYALPEFVTMGVPLLILLLAPGMAYVFVRKRRS